MHSFKNTTSIEVSIILNWTKNHSFIKATLWQATTAAVSVRSLLLPNDIGAKPIRSDLLISSLEKSPSGPISMVVSPLFFKTLLRVFLLVSSQ